MAFGLIPARGPWEQRWFVVNSAATFPKGSLVNLNPEFEVDEYLSTDSQALGIALSHSTASQKVIAGLDSVLVAIPAPGCTAYSDLTTGVVQSDLSVGKAVLIYKQGNYMSYASTVMGQASRFSALVTVAGRIQSDTSQVEVAFNALNTIFYSASSHTYAT